MLSGLRTSGSRLDGPVADRRAAAGAGTAGGSGASQDPQIREKAHLVFDAWVYLVYTCGGSTLSD